MRPPTFLVTAGAAHEELGHQRCARQGQAGRDKDTLGGSDLQKVAPDQAKGHHEQSHVAGPLQGDLPHLGEHRGVHTHLSTHGPAEHVCTRQSPRPRGARVHTPLSPRPRGARVHTCLSTHGPEEHMYTHASAPTAPRSKCARTPQRPQPRRACVHTRLSVHSSEEHVHLLRSQPAL